MNIEDMKKINKDRKKRLAAYLNAAAQVKKDKPEHNNEEERKNYVE